MCVQGGRSESASIEPPPDSLAASALTSRHWKQIFLLLSGLPLSLCCWLLLGQCGQGPLNAVGLVFGHRCVRDGLCVSSRSVEKRVFEVEINRQALNEAADVGTALASRHVQGLGGRRNCRNSCSLLRTLRLQEERRCCQLIVLGVGSYVMGYVCSLNRSMEKRVSEIEVSRQALNEAPQVTTLAGTF